MNSPELPTPGTHYYTTSKLAYSFNNYGYEVLEAKTLDDIVDGSIVIISNHGIYHSDKDNKWALDYLAKKYPNCVYICWFYHRMYDQIPFKKFILTGEHFRKKPSLEFHIQCWDLQEKINNYVPFTFSSALMPNNIGVLPRNEVLNGCFIGTAYKYEWVKELSNIAYISTPGNQFPEEERIKIFLSSKIGFGFHGDANIANNCIVERVFEAMAFGCAVISDNPVAAEITNYIVQIARTKEEFLDIYHTLLSDETKLKDLQARGLEWVKNNGLYIHVAKKFLDKINEFDQIGWTLRA
jgi:spore maturation protein CgeB